MERGLLHWQAVRRRGHSKEQENIPIAVAQYVQDSRKEMRIGQKRRNGTRGEGVSCVSGELQLASFLPWC